MITLLYGPDTYLRDARKKSLVDDIAARGAGDVRVFDVAEASSLAAFGEFVRAAFLFHEKPLAIVTGNIEDKNGWASALTEAQQYVDREIIVVADKKLKGAFSFLLAKPVVCESFEYLTGSAWKTFVEEEAARRGLALAPSALRSLTYEYEKNTWGLITEFLKLKNAGDRIIYSNDLLLARGAQSDFWSTMNQFRSAERRTRLKMLEEALARDDPGKIFYMLGVQFKGREAAVAHADLAIKSGKVDYEEALLGLLL